MATSTTNFNFPIPQSTDLVKDGATAIAALGTSVDTQFVDLKGGTTGQVLAKASNTDLDYSWVTTDDANAIQNAIVDAKGDLIAATANDTPARLAVGNNGETLVADSSATTGLRWQGDYAAGKNKIINGDFGIWQRGTSFTSVNGNYSADRFVSATNKTVTVSQQTFTAGTAPVAGYESTYFLRMAQSASGSFYALAQRVEDVRVFAGQTVTLSFWAKANATVANKAGVIQNFGSGGSAEVANYSSSFNITTSWTRYTYTVTLASISGKTIGTNSYLGIQPILTENATAHDIDIWGVQIEAGSVATAFQTATGTIQGELSAAQRYYYRQTIPTGAFAGMCAAGWVFSTTRATFAYHLPVPMRVAPTALDQANIAANRATTDTRYTSGTWALGGTNGTNNQVVEVFYTHGSAVFTQGDLVFIQTNNASNQFIGFSAEL
jgi:hypothetical protein